MARELPRCISDAVTALLFNSPFFAYLLLEKITIIPANADTIPTGALGMHYACTDGKRMWINVPWFEQEDLQTQIFVLAHETCHAMYMHPQRGMHYFKTGFDGEPLIPEIWGIALDLIINDTLIRAGIGKVDKKRWCWSEKIQHDWSAEAAYRELKKLLPPPPPQGGGQGEDDGEGESGGGQAPSSGQGHGQDADGNPLPQPMCDDAGSDTPYGKRIDDHVLPNQDTMYDNHTEQEWNIAIKKAAEVAKAAGKLPADFERLVGEITEPKVDWREQLRHATVRKLGQDRSTMRRPNRRRMAYGRPRIYMPSREAYGCQLMVVGADTSGSVSDRELGMYLSELSSIISDVNPEKLFFIWIDAAIQEIIEVDNPADIELFKKPKGGGGTDFRPVFKWIDKEGLQPDVCIYFTDLYGPYPNDPPPYPVIWCCTTEKEANWGETIHIDD